MSKCNHDRNWCWEAGYPVSFCTKCGEVIREHI